MAGYTDELLNKSKQTVANYNPNEQVNMADERLTNVNNEREQQITQTNDRYNSMINDSNKFYQDQINIAKEYQDKQIENQNAQTEQTIKEINQQRDKAQREYQKEQRGAYTDYRTQINPYGVNAEIVASKGLQGSGYSESSRVSMYNEYQRRVATARQSLQDAEVQYDNMIANARLTNNTNLAEIAFNFAKTQADLALQGFQYKNNLLQAQESQLNQVNARFDNQYNNILSMLQNELENRRNNYQFASQVLQNQRNFEYQQEQDRLARELELQKFEYQKERDRIADERYNASKSSGGGSGGSRSSGGKSSSSGGSLSVPTGNLTHEDIYTNPHWGRGNDASESLKGQMANDVLKQALGNSINNLMGKKIY